MPIPSDVNIKDNETEQNKYQDMRNELQRNVKAQVVPVVIGALGATVIQKHLINIPVKPGV